LNPITLFNAGPQSGRLERPPAGAYTFSPNNSSLHADRGLVSIEALFQASGFSREVADLKGVCLFNQFLALQGPFLQPEKN